MSLFAMINGKKPKEPIFRDWQFVMMHIAVPEETELKEILSPAKGSFPVVSQCTFPESKTQKLLTTPGTDFPVKEFAILITTVISLNTEMTP